MFKLFHEAKSIKWLKDHKDVIDFMPPYQRQGGLWKKVQRQLLIDSILNGLDVPKFYFQFMPSEKRDKFYNYAIIDGKQRAETILGFLNDEFELSKKFTFFDPSMSSCAQMIAGKTFSEIEILFPAITARILEYELNIVFMDTSELDIINEMFVRLNSGVLVNTAEKRNAMGGKLAKKIREYCNSSLFFTRMIKSNNARFDHHDLMLKFLMLKMGEWDLTKASVNRFLVEQKELSMECIDAFDEVDNALKKFEMAFQEHDKLLGKKNIILSIFAVQEYIPQEHIRPFLDDFERKRARMLSSGQDNQFYDTALLEFNNLLQQGADKGKSIQRRCDILLEYYRQFVQMI